MTDKKVIFKTGELTYPKEWYLKSGLDVKPVVYTDEFLKEIASKTMGSSLELTHGNNSIDVVGHVNSFDFINGELVANVTTDEELKGMGFSPEFSVNFRDKGDKYEAIDGRLLKTILTDSPRSHILCNSVEGNNVDEGGSNVSEETIKILEKQVKDLNREVAQKDAIIEANKKKLGEYDELNERIAKLEKENNDYKSQIDDLTPKAEAFGKIETDMRTDLLTKAFGDDEEAKKPFQNATLEQLESLAKHREVTRKAQGVGAGNGEGIGEGEGEEGGEDNEADQALAFYKKLHNGETPSFIKEQGGE